MTWLSFVTTLVSIVAAIVSYLKDRQSIEAGAAEEAQVHLQGALDALKAATKVRAAVDARTSGPDAADKLRNDPANLYRD